MYPWTTQEEEAFGKFLLQEARHPVLTVSICKESLGSGKKILDEAGRIAGTEGARERRSRGRGGKAAFNGCAYKIYES